MDDISWCTISRPGIVYFVSIQRTNRCSGIVFLEAHLYSATSIVLLLLLLLLYVIKWSLYMWYRINAIFLYRIESCSRQILFCTKPIPLSKSISMKTIIKSVGTDLGTVHRTWTWWASVRSRQWTSRFWNSKRAETWPPSVHTLRRSRRWAPTCTWVYDERCPRDGPARRSVQTGNVDDRTCIHSNAVRRVRRPSRRYVDRPCPN